MIYDLSNPLYEWIKAEIRKVSSNKYGNTLEKSVTFAENPSANGPGIGIIEAEGLDHISNLTADSVRSLFLGIKSKRAAE